MMKPSASFFSSFSSLIVPFAASALIACGGAVDTGGTSPGPAVSATNQAPTPPSPGAHPPAQSTSPSAPTVDNGAWATDASGCGNFFVYAMHSSGLKYLTVRAVKSELGIVNVGDSVTIELGVTPTKTVVAVDTYSHPLSEAPYCSDYISDPLKPETAEAMYGTVTFSIASVGLEGETYSVNVAITGLVVRHADGTLEPVPDVTYHDVAVGWLAG